MYNRTQYYVVLKKWCLNSELRRAFGSVVRDRHQYMWPVRATPVLLSPTPANIPLLSRCHLSACALSPFLCLLPSPLFCFLSMGRPGWATAEQAEFLEAFLPNLDQEKKGNGLNAFYGRISLRFLEKWPAVPTNEELQGASDEKVAQDRADARRKSVSPPSLINACHVLTIIHCQQISEWYRYRKRKPAAPQPKEVLDLSGKGRKLSHLQFHHAFSVRYFRPEDSELRKEITSLWERRDEEEVVELLTPFVTANDFSNRLEFHNTVMRWKCSLLTAEQRKEHENWINEFFLKQEEAMNQPWKAMQEADANELAAENNYIQRYASVASFSGVAN